MTRRIGVKGKKRKKREENYDKEEVEQMQKDDTTDTAAETQTQAEECNGRFGTKYARHSRYSFRSE